MQKRFPLARTACSVIALAALLSACTSQMRVVVERSEAAFDFAPKPADSEVRVLEADEAVPPNELLIARMKVRDTGTTVDCGYENVLAQALAKAREIGGDLVQLTQVHPPDLWSSCYRLDADVYAVQAGAAQ
jgi:hypothetical protein